MNNQYLAYSIDPSTFAVLMWQRESDFTHHFRSEGQLPFQRGQMRKEPLILEHTSDVHTAKLRNVPAQFSFTKISTKDFIKLFLPVEASKNSGCKGKDGRISGDRRAIFCLTVSDRVTYRGKARATRSRFRVPAMAPEWSRCTAALIVLVGASSTVTWSC